MQKDYFTNPGLYAHAARPVDRKTITATRTTTYDNSHHDAKLWEVVSVKFIRWDFDENGRETQARYCHFPAYRLRQPNNPKRRRGYSIDVFRALHTDLRFPVDGERFIPGEGEDKLSHDGEKLWAYPIGAYVIGNGLIEFVARSE